MPRATNLRLALALSASVPVLLSAACGGKSVPPGSAAASADAGPLVQPPLDATYDGGGLTLDCVPSVGGGPPSDAGLLAPLCTYVDALACHADSDCGCGCSCQCGLCDCSRSSEPGAIQNPPCPGGGTGAAAEWIGTWTGSFDWPSTVYGGTCASGLEEVPGSGGGGATGPMTITIVGDGAQLSFQVKLGAGSGQAACALPFDASGAMATLVAGSACVTMGAGNVCTVDGPVFLETQTFLSGTATIGSNGTMTLEARDVFAIPQQLTPGCGGDQDGQDQVNVESLMATLTRE